jgi:5'(3')-deoxyribonucleotidase
MNIGIDVDDVLCNFQERFVVLLNSLYDRPPLDTAPVDWDWSNCQMSKEEMSNAWLKATEVHNLWASLKPLPNFDLETEELLYQAHTKHDVYFVTNRFATTGVSPLKQTKYWIGTHTNIKGPNVIIAKDKGSVATLLQLDYFFDDMPKNCYYVLAAMPYCNVFLCDASHNQAFSSPFITRLANLKEFLKIVLEVK